MDKVISVERGGVGGIITLGPGPQEGPKNYVCEGMLHGILWLY